MKTVKRIIPILLLALCMQVRPGTLSGAMPVRDGGGVLIFTSSKTGNTTAPGLGGYATYSLTWQAIGTSYPMFQAGGFTGTMTPYLLDMYGARIAVVFDPVGSDNVQRYSHDTVWVQNWDTALSWKVNWKVAPVSSVNPKGAPVPSSVRKASIGTYTLTGRKAVGRNAVGCYVGLKEKKIRLGKSGK